MIIQNCLKICNGLPWIPNFNKCGIQPLIYFIKNNHTPQILSCEKSLKSFTMNWNYFFKSYHTYYRDSRYMSTPHLRFTVAPTSTKIKNDATWARRIWELPLLLQVSKLKTTPILHSANYQQHLSGHIFLLSFPNCGVHLIVLEAALFTVRARRG